MTGKHKPGVRSEKTGGFLPDAVIPSVRCSAHRKNGNQCASYAMVGGSVCRVHGGSAPQVREAARRRIIALVPKALFTMSEMLSAESEAVRVRAATDILDRAGLKASEQLTIIPQSAPNEELDAAIIEAMKSRGLVTEALAALEQSNPATPATPATEGEEDYDADGFRDADSPDARGDAMDVWVHSDSDSDDEEDTDDDGDAGDWSAFDATLG